MIAAGRLAAAFAALLFPRPPAAGVLAVSTPASLDEVIATVLAPAPTATPAPMSTPGPLVLGVGELHQTAGTAAIASSLSRFTHNVWPLIAARVSDLIVETWVTDGACGKAEAATVGDVSRTTERPAATENEIVALLTRAKASGARPHILKVSCAEYQLLAPPGGGGASQPIARTPRGLPSGVHRGRVREPSEGSREIARTPRGLPSGVHRGRVREPSEGSREIDFERMLALIEQKLEAMVTDVLATRPVADADKLIVVYGGALHNDLHPDPVLAPFSYGLRVFHATAGRYRELDLYVPEYLERNAAMHGEPWFAAWERAAAPGHPVLIRRSPASFIVVLAKDKD